MKIKYIPVCSDDVISYQFDGDVITVTYNNQTEIIDLTGIDVYPNENEIIYNYGICFDGTNVIITDNDKVSTVPIDKANFSISVKNGKISVDNGNTKNHNLTKLNKKDIKTNFKINPVLSVKTVDGVKMVELIKFHRPNAPYNERFGFDWEDKQQVLEQNKNKIEGR